jgi:hypothetical protein
MPQQPIFTPPPIGKPVSFDPPPVGQAITFDSQQQTPPVSTSLAPTGAGSRIAAFQRGETPGSQMHMPVGDMAATAGRTVLDTSDALSYPLRDPQGFAQMVLSMPEDFFKAHGSAAQTGFDAIKNGKPVEGAARLLVSAIPALGPLFIQYADAPDQATREQIAGNGIASIVAGKVPEMLPTRIGIPSMRTAMKPQVAGALDAARTEGVPVSAGVATGNRALTSVTQLAEKTTATGASAVNRAALATEQGLGDWADRIARDSNPTGTGATTGAQAGQQVFDTLKQTIKQEGATAEKSYSAVEDAQNAGRLNGVPLPAIRAVLKPIYDHLDSLNRSTGGLDAATAPGQTKAYLDLFMKAQVPGATSPVGEMPVVAAERVLGNLKEALRSQNNQFGATSGQLRTIIKTVQGQIDAAVKVDPDAFQALQDGRLATANKYRAASTLDNLAGTDQMRSPITATNALLSDAGLVKLRRLASQSPDTVQNLGRSFFEDAFKEARIKENGFKLDNAARDWRSMSDETKQILYKDAIAKDPNYLSRVDDLFTAASKIQENVNPSGSAAAGANYLKLLLAPMEAVVGAASGHPTMGVIAAGGTVAQDLLAGQFAKAMNNPTIVRLMVNGMTLAKMSPTVSTSARLAANIASIQSLIKAGNTIPQTATGARVDSSLGVKR